MAHSIFAVCVVFASSGTLDVSQPATSGFFGAPQQPIKDADVGEVDLSVL